jgi:pimeloyl-[acyl-carrier protein] methyl ester esterase
LKEVPILLISGWAHGAESMFPLAEAVKESHPVSCVSISELLMEGNGDDAAGPETASASISPYAGAVVRRLKSFEGPACIIGWSTGGIVAIEAAASCPQRVAGLVLLSSTARFCAAGTAEGPCSQAYTAGVEPAALRAMIRKLKRNPEEAVAEFLLQAVFPMTVAADELVCRTRNALEPGKDCLIDGLEYLARADLRVALRSIVKPCLVIHGGQDRIVPWRAARFLGSNLPLSKVELLSSAGHLLIEQGGEDLIHRTAQFVESL